MRTFEYPVGFGIPNASYLHCPICGEMVHVTTAEDDRYPEVICAEAETFAWHHFANRHPRRFWLYRTTGIRFFIGGLV